MARFLFLYTLWRVTWYVEWLTLFVFLARFITLSQWFKLKLTERIIIIIILLPTLTLKLCNATLLSL